MKCVKPILRYPGSKARLAPWIVAQLPAHTVYCEPYAGTAAVLFAKPRSPVEIVNDLHHEIINLFQVLRAQPEAIVSAIERTPWSRVEYESGLLHSGDPCERARRFLVRSWQGYGTPRSVGSGWLVDRTGKAKPSRSITWRKLPERLAAAADRLHGVHIDCQPALEVIATYDSPETLLYVDPPYVGETRSARLYDWEMSLDDHVNLLAALKAHPGPVVLSGYAHPLYQAELAAWRCVTHPSTTLLQVERTECLWIKERT